MYSPEPYNQIHITPVIHCVLEKLAGFDCGACFQEPSARVFEVVCGCPWGGQGRETGVLALVGDGEVGAEIWVELGGFGKLLGLEEVDLGVGAEIGVGVLDAEGVDVVLVGLFGVEDETAELDVVAGTEVSEEMAGHFRKWVGGEEGILRWEGGEYSSEKREEPEERMVVQTQTVVYRTVFIKAQ